MNVFAGAAKATAGESVEERLSGCDERDRREGIFSESMPHTVPATRLTSIRSSIRSMRTACCGSPPKDGTEIS